MGNSETKQTNEGQDPLRDYCTEFRVPSNISRPTSNLLLAYADGHYYPCIILRRAKNITNGYLVFFFHSQTETEIHAVNAIGNFKALLDCDVSFTVDGKQYCGKVYEIITNEKNEASNFFICCENQCACISLPFIYLTLAQAKQVCC